MLKTLGRTDPVQGVLGFLAAHYLRLVRATTHFVEEPAGFRQSIGPELPVIAAMWHGQHFLMHAAWPEGASIHALVSRHGDGEINARALRRLGVTPIRGSGGAPGKTRRRGGARAMREMLRALESGSSVVLTADIPKCARIAGKGIVALAQLSGRPIFPIAVATRPRIDLPSWDHASLSLPGGRGAMVLGSPIHVPRAADDALLEQARIAVETGLNAVHSRAYRLIDSMEPGAPPARERA